MTWGGLLALLLVQASMTPAPSRDAEGPRCVACGRAVLGGFIRLDDGRVFCNQACFRTVLPRCAACARPLTGESLGFEGRLYCGERCLSTALPKCDLCGVAMKVRTELRGRRFCASCMALPRCSECLMPSPSTVPLRDGRRLCAGCEKAAVFGREQAEALYRRAARRVEEVTGRAVSPLPSLELLGVDRLSALLGPAPAARGLVRGHYSQQVTRTLGGPGADRVQKSIHLLYGMKPDNVLIAGAHELGHDWLSERFPRLDSAPQWMKEGVCQYLAATVARRESLPDLNVFERTPDLTYGGGYRFFTRTLGVDNWQGLVAWLEGAQAQDLPLAPPE